VRAQQTIVAGFVACSLSLMAAASGIAAEQPRAAAMSLATTSDAVTTDSNFSATAPNENAVHILVGRSLFIDTKLRLSRVYVTNPEVLSAYAAGPNQVLVTTKDSGISSIVVWDQSGESQPYLISSDLDVEKLRSSIKTAMPSEDIEVASDGGRILLSGVVSTSAASDEAAKLADLYSKNVFNGLVINSSRVRQIKLKVRIVEIDRSKLTQLGVNLFSAAGNSLVQSSTLQFPSELSAVAAGSAAGIGSGIATSIGDKAVSISNPLNFLLYNSSLNVGAMLQDLEDKQILQILAEPTITAMSGEKASFLSGGEFPFPVVQGISGGTTSISVQFRPFGVKLDFTPEVNIDGTIQLSVAPEVSALDYTNAVTIDGYEIPALSTRRAETKVVLKSGQSFAISGLLDRRITDEYSRTPGIASIPILGELFKSKSLNHARSDLVVVVTPEIVDPLSQAVALSEPEPELPVPFLDPGAFDPGVTKSTKSK
jgi:pilus assembly protein CpaC